ncbi:MAG: hypothetical protein FWF31_11985 [Desulfobulbus sp.]|nr:hypothetical protein [Desulfobulbus sp.]
MKSLYILASVAALMILTACSMTVPVRGQFSSGEVAFTGNATAYIGGKGEMMIFGSNGLTCKGNFVYTDHRRGEGTFTCSDGRSGPFSFAAIGSSGTGTGKIGNDILTFTFGN